MTRRIRTTALMAAIAAVLCLGSAASALATPSLTSVSPTSGSNADPGSITLRVNGQNLTDFLSTPDVTLSMASEPYAQIYATDVSVVPALGGQWIECYVDLYGKTAGTYDVQVSGLTRFGQYVPDTYTLKNAFKVTGTSPIAKPTIASIKPATATAGGPAFKLTVYGSNFSAGAGGSLPAVIYWNSTALTTSPVGNNWTTTLSATVPASFIASAGTASITVMNPLLGGGTSSNAIRFTITTVQPTLTNVSPTSGFARYYQPYLLTLTGTDFQTSSQVLVNGAVHSATYVSATRMTVQLTAADIAGPGTLNIAVRNSAGGMPTNTQTFTIMADTTAPVTTISGADNAWHNTPVTLSVGASDPGGPGVLSTYYGIGVSPTLVLSGSTITVPAPAGGAGDGARLVQVYSKDKCGNAETPPVTATVNICTKGPDTSAFAPASVKKGKKLKLGYECDSITPQCSVTIRIFKANGATAKTIAVGQKPSNKQGSYSFTCNLAPGNYKVKVFAVDAAGNQQSSQDGDSFSVTK